MGAPSIDEDTVEKAFYNRPLGTLSDETTLLSLAYCLGRLDIRSIRDLNRLTESEKREACRILASFDPPLDSAITLSAVAADRSHEPPR